MFNYKSFAAYRERRGKSTPADYAMEHGRDRQDGSLSAYIEGKGVHISRDGSDVSMGGGFRGVDLGSKCYRSDFRKGGIHALGFPRVVLSNNAPQFRGTSWQKRCKSWGVLAYTTPAYHPQANPTERRNQEIKKGLRLQIAGGRQRDWDLHLPPILFSMRRRINRTTGQSPSQMLLGRNLPRPGEWSFDFNEATQGRVDDVHQRQAALAALPMTKDDGPLRVGDSVLAKNFTLSNAAEGFNAQLAPKWTGPFTVLEKCSGDVFILERPGRENIKLHVSTLKRVPQPPHAETADAALQPDDPPRARAPPL